VRDRATLQAEAKGTPGGASSEAATAPHMSVEGGRVLHLPAGMEGSSVTVQPTGSSIKSIRDWLDEGETKLHPGLHLDRYELLWHIGRGGMASVWLARLRGKHGFEKLVAVKTIVADRSDDVRFRQMFLDEARIASGIDHVNVARILDLGEHDGVLYLVMEWVDGESVSRLAGAVRQAGARVPPGIALRIVADACRGLHAAHDLQDRSGTRLEVVHRDVSPQNILLSVEGVAKVIDFGIAKARDRLAGDTSDGALKGKLPYMAPEQARGLEIDRRADVWALGAVLYHLLSGVPPYKGPSDAATFALLTSGMPPHPLPGDVPAPVAEVVRRALSPLEGRYRSAAELEEAIEAAMIESDLATRPADVAGYLETHLGDRLAKRRALVREAAEASGRRTHSGQIALPEPSPQRSATTAARRGQLAKVAVPAAVVIAGFLGVVVAPRVRGGLHDGFTPGAIVAGHAATTSDSPAPPSASEKAVASRPLPAPGMSETAAPQATTTADPRPRPEPKRPTSTRPRHDGTAECDPPYTVDSSGIRLYKRACMY
jgi:serine/threonine protein kinase